MSHSHSHSSGHAAHIQIPRGSRAVLLTVLGLIAIATLIGLHSLWPEHSSVQKAAERAQFAAPGVSFPTAQIIEITKGCNAGGEEDSYPTMSEQAAACDLAKVKVLDGDQAGRISEIQLQGPMASAGLSPGDRIELMSVPITDSDENSSSLSLSPQESGSTTASDGSDADSQPQVMDSAFGINRNHSLMMLTIGFVLLVLLVARHRGFFSLLALVFSGFMLVKFMLPALVSGGPGLGIALVGSSAIMFVVLYVAHGPSIRTSTALAGTLCGIGITAAVTQYAVASTHLSGYGDEASGMLSTMAGNIDFRGLLTCAIIFAGLGVLNDVTITQASSVWELRAAAPEATRREIFKSAMRIGRDHIGSTIYTIVFAYAGAAMSVLLLLYLYNLPALDLLTQEDIATEIVRSLCSAIGLVAAVPITTGIAAYLAAPADPSDVPEIAQAQHLDA